MDDTRTSDVICRDFNHHLWHDSKLLEFRLVHGEDRSTGDLVVDLVLRGGAEGRDDLQPAELVIRECTLVDIKIDLEAKAACGHDIAGASCEERSEYMKSLERTELKHETNPFAGFVHFRIMLCPTGGEIQAIGRDFEINISPRASRP